MTDDTKPAPAATGKISPKLAEMLATATPEQREKAIEIVSKLLGRRAFREATGQTDRTKPLMTQSKKPTGSTTKLSPQDEQTAVMISTKLLNLRAKRETEAMGGTVDLTKAFDPHAKVSETEPEQAPKSPAQQDAAEISIVGKLKILPSAFDQMGSEGSTAWVAVPNGGPAQD